MSYQPHSTDIAITGMAASFAGAENLRDYWQHLIGGKSVSSRKPTSRESLDGEPRREVNDDRRADAALSLSLKLIREALDDAGHLRRPLNQDNYIFLSLCRPLSPRSIGPGEAETDLRWLAARVADKLGLTSRSVSVCDGFSSSLAAIKAAATALLARTCDVALAGGVQSFAPLRSGARPLDASATESPAGAGAVVVLKRLADAQQDNDHIYAVLKNIYILEHERAEATTAAAANSEGESTLAALRRAYDESGVEPQTIALVEMSAADSSSVVGRQVQLLSGLFGARKGNLSRCALGIAGESIEATGAETSGVASLIKAALALSYKILPPTGSDRLDNELNPAAETEPSPFYLNREPRAWIHGSKGNPRRAGVCDFTSEGLTAHAILEECANLPAAQETKFTNAGWPSELLCFSGDSREELLSLITDVQAFIAAHPFEPIAHLAFSLSGRATGRKHRLAVLASDFSDLTGKLNLAVEKLRGNNPARWQIRNSLYYAEPASQRIQGQVAFMFPGYGSYYPGMLADLCLHFPPVRDWFDTLDEIFDEAHGPLPSQLLFPPSTKFSDERQATTSQLHSQRGGGQGGFTATLALHELLQSFGVRCDVMVGHSNGENAALIASGIMDFKTRREMFELTRRYTEHDDHVSSTNDIPKGVFLGVSTPSEEFLEELLASSGGDVHLAIDNCPHQVVLFGSEESIEAVRVRIASAGGIALRLPSGRAYHTPLYEAQAEDMRPVYAPLALGPGHTRVYSCASVQPFPAEPDAIRALAIKQWSSRVRFRETIEKLYGDGVRTFVEVGPNNTLAGFVDDTLRGREHLTVVANTQRRPGLEQIERLLAQLFVAGMKLNLEYLFRFRDVRPVQLKSYPAESRPEERTYYVSRSSSETNETIVAAHAQRETVAAATGNGFHHDRAQPATPTVAAQQVVFVEDATGVPGDVHQSVEESAPLSDARLAILRGHFDLMQQFLASQSRIMSSLFAGNTTAAAVFKEHAASAGFAAPLEQHRAAEQEAWPLLLGRVVEIDAPRRLYCERRFDLENDSFLRDHALGRPVPGDDLRLSPLPVMPFTMSMEILAEAALYLSGGQKRIVGISNVRGHRWLMLERGSLLLGVLAEAKGSPVDGVQEEVHVRLFELEATPNGGRQLAFEGTVRLADEYPASPPPLPIQVDESERSKVSAAEFYQQYAFHGSCFQGIKRLLRRDARGIEVELEATRASEFFRESQAAVFQTPAGLLDTTGQLVGLWLIAQGITDFAVFPFHAASYEQFAKAPAPGSRIICRGAIGMKDAATSEASFDMLDEAGRVIARLEGLQLRNYSHSYIPRFFKPLTGDTYFSDAWMQEETGLACRAIDSRIAAFLDGSGGFWKRVLAHLVLDIREREEWYALPEKGARRTEWLMGRAAAKDAVRQWAAQTLKLQLAFVEISIRTNDAGQPFVKCPALENMGRVPHISISHKRGLAVAAAAVHKIGIDVEELGLHQDNAWLQTTFDAEELALAGEPDVKTLLGLWCAREAASKAAGTGLRGDPRGWRIVGFSKDAGLVRVASGGEVWDVSLWYRETTAFAVCQPAGVAGYVEEASVEAAAILLPRAMRE